MQPDLDYIFKYIIIGDSSVGKSCLLLNYTDDRFQPVHEMTIGVEFGIKIININGKCVKLQIWDTAGQQSFKSITRSYYRGTAVALLVYDITKRSTFISVIEWIEDVKMNGNEDTLIVLVGNKIDINEKRVVSYEEGLCLAEEHNMFFRETSAKTGDGVVAAFTDIASVIMNKLTSDSTMIPNGVRDCSKDPDSSINLNKKHTSSKCCSR